ncbi:MAG: hypothetical protein ABI678_11415 [Kofleriaceae bacterium]
MAATSGSLSEGLRRVVNDLLELSVPFALVGGLAVSARAEPRLTRDIGVAVGGEVNPEEVVQRFLGRRYRVEMVVEQTRVDRLSTVRLVPARSGFVLDLLFASSGIESEIVNAAELLDVLEGLRLPVARTGHLIAMKLLAADARQRPQDLDDIRALLVTASAVERRRVTTAIGLIERRGFARGRDLQKRWRDARDSYAPRRRAARAPKQ